MPHYHVAFNGKAGTNTANKIIANLWAVSRKARVVEVGIFLQTVTATAPLFALQRASARGTQSTSLTPIQKDASDPAATCALDTAWSVDPTFSTANPQIRSAGVALAAGNGFVWNLDEVEILSGAGLAIFNVNATGATLGSYAGYVWYLE
jgi:hypothetical protein